MEPASKSHDKWLQDLNVEEQFVHIAQSESSTNENSKEDKAQTKNVSNLTQCSKLNLLK